MIDLHNWPTPNGHKITLRLEEPAESGLPPESATKPADNRRGGQCQPEFLAGDAYSSASMTSAPRIDATPGMSPDLSAWRPPVPAHVRQKVNPQAGRPLGQEQCRHLFGSDTSRH